MEHINEDAVMTNSIQHVGKGGAKRKEPADGESERVVAHEQEEEAQPSTSGAARRKKKKPFSDLSQEQKGKNKILKLRSIKKKRQCVMITRAAGEKPKPNPIPYDDALGGKKYKIKLVGHRVEKGTGEEGKDKLLVAVLYTRKTSLVRVSEFVKAPDVLREYLNAAERQVAKTVYLWMAEVPVKLNPTLLERIAEAKLLSAPKHILMDNTEKGSGTSSTKFFSLLGGTKVALSKKGDFLPLKIEGDNSEKESVWNMTEDLMLHTVWQPQLWETDFENCEAHRAIDMYFKGEEIPIEDRDLYRRLKGAAIEKSKERRHAIKSANLERLLARKAADLSLI